MAALRQGEGDGGSGVIEAERAAGAGRAAVFALAVYAVVQAVAGTLWLLSLGGIWLFSNMGFWSLASGVLVEAICWVLVPVWTYRAMAAAHRAMPALAISPGWAVGWFYVPIMGLWKPLEAIGQIWQGSQGKTYADGGTTPESAYFWWAAWLVHMACLLLGVWAFSPVVTNGFVLMAGIGGLSGAIAAALLIVVIRQVGRFQAKASDVSVFA